MFIHLSSPLGRGLTLVSRRQFSLVKSVLHYLRTVMNRVRWQQNREFSALQTRNSNVPKSVQAANKLFIAGQQALSLSQKARMERIDQILGTKTHFHDLKVFQERLDSDHIMDLQELKRQHKEPSRMQLDWTNPQASVKIRYKNKRKYYKFVSSLRTYPSHLAGNPDLNDQVNQSTIDFLGKQAVYSKISLKPVELSQESIESEFIGSHFEQPFQSQNYCYFRPQGQMQLFRIAKNLYRPQLVTDQALFEQQGKHIQQVIGLQQIYDVLKHYDVDQRVNDYIKKIQNNRLEYLFSDFACDRSEKCIAVFIDLLGTKKQYCLIVKNLTLAQYTPVPIFNVRPRAVFSPDGQAITYVQRSQEGGWIQLVYRSLSSCFSLKDSKEVSLSQFNSQSQGQKVFRCDADKEMILGTDSNNTYIFITMRAFANKYSQSLFVLNPKDSGEMELIALDQDGSCRFEYDLGPTGVCLTKYYKNQAEWSLKHGQHMDQAKQLWLIPFKQQLQLARQQKIGMSDGYLPINISQSLPSPAELDPTAKRVLYRAEDNQFIVGVQVRQSHLILLLSFYSVYNKNILYFLPFKPSSHPHYLVLPGSSPQLQKHSYKYRSQTVVFNERASPIQTLKTYSIWKRQLADSHQGRYHYELLPIRQGPYPLDLQIICRKSFMQDKMPVLLFCPTRHQQLHGVLLRQFLEKGVMVARFRGRGTLVTDLEHFLAGSRHNFPCLMDDMQHTIQYIGNHLSRNISLYCKGGVSSLVGLFFNLYFPRLFNTSVLHNGIYDLEDQTAMLNYQHFFGNDPEMKQKWEKFNFFKHKFMTPFRQDQSIGEQRLIGALQNVIISSDKGQRLHSRKLIKRLRENQWYKYQQVFLKEYESDYEADLTNLSFAYSKIRQRMEQEINQPEEDEDQAVTEASKTKEEVQYKQEKNDDPAGLRKAQKQQKN